MKITIYNPDATVFQEVVLLDGSMMTNGIREDHDVTLCFSSEEELAIPEGAYVVFNGETFIAKSKSKMEMSHTRSYTYTVKMNGAPSALSSVRLRNPADGKLSFPYTASAHDHLALIVSNMNRYGGGGWSVGDCIDGGDKFLQYNYISCRDALDSLADTYGTEWEIVGKTISLHKVEYNLDSPLELSYGKGSGLRPGIIRDNVQTPMTRLYTQGGSKNIDASEYGSTILLLPKSVTFKYDGNKFEDEQGFDETKARIYSTDSEGTYIKSHKNESRDVNEGVIDCTDIYPNKLYTVLEVESGDNPRDIVLDIDENLDYSQYQIAGEVPTITFQSGELMGKTFEIRRDQGGVIMVSKKYSEQGSFVGWKLTLSGTFESGRWLPDTQSGLVPAVGDTCRIFGVMMPSQYISSNDTKSGASWDMLRRGIMYLYEYEDYIYSLKMPVDPIWARANWSSVGSKFVAGGYVRYSNSGWAQGGVVMRIKTIRQDISKPYSIEISLSNGIVGGGVLKGLSDSISNQAGSISEQQDTQKRLEYNVSSLSGNYVTIDTPQTITAPKTFAGDVTFGAAKEDGSYSRLLIPSSSGPGMYDLYVSTEPVDGEVPTASGGIDEDELWSILGTSGTQQIDASHMSNALAGYATQQWVQQQGYLTSVGVSDIGGLGEGWSSLLGSAPDFYSKSSVYSKSEADDRFVGIANEQTISGKKSFTALLTASAGISSTDADLSGYVSASKLYIPFSGNNRKYSLLISTAPVGGEVPSASGGIDETELWAILTDGAGGERIVKSHLPSDAVYQSALSSYALKTDIPSLDGYATQEWVKGKGYLTSVSLSTISDLHSSWDSLLSAEPSGYITRWPSFSEVTGTPTTLEGYGITDAYTKSGVDSLLLGYVTLSTEQEIKAKKTFSAGLAGTDADFIGYVSATRLYVPHSGNNRKYFISVVTAPVGGEAPDEGLGIDEDELWTILGTYGTQQIDLSHIPVIPVEKVSGLSTALASYATQEWVKGKGYLTSVSLSTISDLHSSWDALLKAAPSAYVTRWPTAAEVGALTQGAADGRYAKKDGSNATGTWPVSISGNAATADISNYLFLNPNNGTLASQNDAVPANGRFAIYDVNTATTAGGSDGYIMAFRWPSGNFATQVFLDADDTGIMALRHRNNSNVWTDWYRILHSGNIGSYALTPSNYTSTLDSRYVNVYGDTMTGTLNISSSSEALIRYQISGSNKAASGYLTGTGAYLYSWPASKYLNITDAGSLLFGGSTVWHSGNDGAGSGLDADLLDGNHASRYTRCQGAYNYITFTVGGDANTYYPVHIHSVSDYYPSTLVNITRRYNEAAPNTWNTATHRGGLTLCILWNNSVYWDGNGAGNPFQRVLECVQTYSTMVGGLDTSHYNGGGMVVWLRGGGAVYHVYSDQGTELSVSVYLSSFTDSANRTFAPTTTPKSIDRWRQLDIKASSATKLANSRTLWGRPFDGTANVSGDMTGVGSFTGVGRFKYGASDESDAAYGKYHRLNLGYHSIDHTDFYEHVFNFYSNGGGTTWAKIGSTNYFSGNVGIGTTSPAYKLDVAGEIRATTGISIGSNQDYGWYISGSRIVAGGGTARGVNVGSLLVSNAWADYTKVPTNGIYSKGDIWTGGKLFIPSSSGNNVFDAYIA